MNTCRTFTRIILHKWHASFLAISEGRTCIRLCSNFLVSEEVHDSSRCIPKTMRDYQLQKLRRPCQPKNPKLLKVAILGEPNAGKSTLINTLMGWKVCSVSEKVHTTRHKAAAVCIDDNTQIVFLDTPGLVDSSHCKKHRLETSFLMDPKKCLKEADLIAVIIDASNKWTRMRINPNLLDWLKTFPEKRSCLILNKVDIIKSKNLLLDITRTLTKGVVAGSCFEANTKRLQLKDRDLNSVLKRTEKNSQEASVSSKEDESVEEGFSKFDRVFMVSALHADGTQDVKEYMLQCAKPHPWMFHESVVTDQNPEHLAVLTVREKLLNHLPLEVPYLLQLKIEMWEFTEGNILKIVMVIKCPKKSHHKMIVGPEGQTIATIAKEARQDLSNTFRCDVALKLIMKSPYTVT